jgi:general secretion pathway protein G
VASIAWSEEGTSRDAVLNEVDRQGEDMMGTRGNRLGGGRPLGLARLRRLARSRGVTLIEILIVLAIVGLIAGGIAVFAIPKFKDAQIQTTKQSAQQLHTIAEGWHATHTQECPTAELLKKEKEIATTSNINDAWGKPFKIECLDDGDIVVTSFGPDGKENTADDIRVPEAAKN